MAITEAKKRNNANYTAKCDYINVRPLKAEGAAIRAAVVSCVLCLKKFFVVAFGAGLVYVGQVWPEHNTNAG